MGDVAMKNALVVEDIPGTRKWLCDVVTRAFPEANCFEAASFRDGLELVRRTSLDLCVIDLNLPDGHGLELLPEIRTRSGHAVCVVATVAGDDASIVSALAAGVEGYLLKDQPPDVLVAQLRQITIGIPALSPVIAQRLIQHFRNTGPARSDASLTARESQVLALIGRGLRNAEVAKELAISVTTVAGYIKAIYRKLGISSRAEAAWHAKQMGLW